MWRFATLLTNLALGFAASAPRSQCLAQLRTTRHAADAAEAELCDGLRDVTLILHCRQDQEICDLRRPLLDGYRKYFKEVKWLVSSAARDDEISCPLPATRTALHPFALNSGDPFQCVAEATKQLDSAGVLYMHFDALLSPCRFAQSFESAKLGMAVPGRFRDYQRLDFCNDPANAHLNCSWHLWTSNRANFSTALLELRQLYPEFDRKFPQFKQGCWLGYFDFWYLPQRAWPRFRELAEVFTRHGVYLEVAGHNMMKILEALDGLQRQDYACLTDVFSGLSLETISGPEFLCGHEIRYQEEGVPEAVESIIQNRIPIIHDRIAALDLSAPQLDRRIWELPVLCVVVLALGIASCCLEPFVESMAPRALSLLLCGLYVLISVSIDLSIAQQSEGGYSFEPMCAVLLTELLKLLVSLLLVRGAAPAGPEVAWLMTAAAVFTLNNILVWWAIDSNEISTFGILRDTMLLWTALFWRSFFASELGWPRLLGIAVVFLGLALKQLQLGQMTWGAPLVLAMTCCNAFGSVLNEFALKRHQSNINVQNSVLYASCAGFTAATMLLSGHWHSAFEHGFFHGFTHHTMFTITLQTLAGLTVSRILKYADAVQKNIAACLRGPILVLLSPLAHSQLDLLTISSAVIVASGCLVYLLQGPLQAKAA